MSYRENVRDIWRDSKGRAGYKKYRPMAVKPMLAIYTRQHCSNSRTFTEYLASDGHAMDILSGTTQTQGSSGRDSCARKPPGIPPEGTVVRPVTQNLRKEIDAFKPILNNIPVGLVCLGEESVPWCMLRRKSKVRFLAILLMLPQPVRRRMPGSRSTSSNASAMPGNWIGSRHILMRLIRSRKIAASPYLKPTSLISISG